MNYKYKLIDYWCIKCKKSWALCSVYTPQKLINKVDPAKVDRFYEFIKDGEVIYYARKEGHCNCNTPFPK